MGSSRKKPMFHFYTHTWWTRCKGSTFPLPCKESFFFLEKLSSLLELCGVNRISSFPKITARGVYLNKHSGNNNASSIRMLLLVGPSDCSLAIRGLNLNSRKHWNVVESLSCRFCFPL